MLRSTLVNTMQLATWDFPQAGGVLPQCSRREWGGRMECKKKTRRGRKGVMERPLRTQEKELRRDPTYPGKPHLLLGLGLLKSLFKVCYSLEL